MQHTFLYISLPSLHDCDVKFPQVTFRGGRKHRLDYKFLFLPLNLVAVPKNSIPGKFTYIRLRFYTSRKNRDQHLSLLNSDVFATVAVVVDKAPYYGAVKNLPSGGSICKKMRFRCSFSTGDVWTVGQTEEKLSVFMCPERELRFLLYSYQPLYSS